MNITPEARELLGSIGLRKHGKRLVWAAYQENAEGVIRCAREAREYQRAAGVLVRKVSRGEHLLPSRRTGWRWVRGTHSGTFVRDPNGTDVPPQRYDLASPFAPPLADREGGGLAYLEDSG